MSIEDVITKLKNTPDIIPDEYDGSYELMRELIASYSLMPDYSACDFRDLNAIYAMAIGTWKLNPEKKKDYLHLSHLAEEEKQRMVHVIDRIWDNACHGKYQNKEGNKPTFGMFGTGFYSFQNKTTTQHVQAFVALLVSISRVDNDDEIYDLAENVLTSDFQGMGAASASVILHCLKPNTFPVLNSNMGHGNIFDSLNVTMNRPGEIGTYIDNCRTIKRFRDENFTFRNYRVFDRMAWEIEKLKDDQYEPALKDYDPGVTAVQYKELFSNPQVFDINKLDTIYFMYRLGGEASCLLLEKKFGNTAQHYNSNATNTAKKIQQLTGCLQFNGGTEENSKFWPILFQGRFPNKKETGTFIWRMRKPLKEAVEELDAEGFFEGLSMKDMMLTDFDKNLILYGPPGTGKTFSTIIYAVAIIEKKEIKSIREEAELDYNAVKARFEDYKEQGRIAFTTFHQSYGYEEFIEGIKPKMDEDADSELEYSVESGIFKAFCERASVPLQKEERDYGFNKSPVVWKVSLGGTYDNPIRSECMESNHIRIGWDEYGPDITEDTISTMHGGVVLNTFANRMRIGDIVFSCYTSSTIDAIGVVTGEYEWNDQFESYKRVRAVRWLVKGIREDIVEINSGATMTLSTVYQMRVGFNDAYALIQKYCENSEADSSYKNDDNYVFVIDEINRGNISKIFGELITLIEDSKRIGAKEELRISLPYSPNQLFGVPQNVYILGTMNTADRSLTQIDTALRRRFAFEEMMPDYEVLRKKHADRVVDNGMELDVAAMLEVINKRIECLYDREHTIGHAFFMDLQDAPTIDTLAGIFKKKVIPLLQEFFYEDYGKIQLVLGDDGKTADEKKKYQFIRDTDVVASDLFETAPDVDLPDKKYEIQWSALNDIRSYKMISKGL